MLPRIRRALAADDGISLVEILVAMVLLGVVLSAGASTLISSFTALAANENRTRATALANEELENLRALPWQELGFYTADTFPAGMPSAYPTVILGPTRPAGSRAPRPRVVQTRGAVAYTVTRTVEWVDNPATSSSNPNVPSNQDFKRLAVNVAWTDGSGAARSIDVASTRSPTPSEQPASDFVLSLYDVQPGIVHLNEAGTIATGQSPSPLQFSALTSAQANFLNVSFVDRDGATVSSNLTTPGDGVTWSGSHSTARFPNGEVIFTFRATRSWPVEQEVIGRRIVRFLQPLRFTDFQLTPASPTTCLELGAPTPAVQVDVHVNGMTQEDTVSVTWAGQSAPASPVPGGATSSGTGFRAMIPPGSYDASTPVVVTATRAVPAQQTESLATDPPGQIVVSRRGDPGCEG